MSAQSTALNTDTNGVKTSAQYGDRGDGTSDWFLRTRQASEKAEDSASASGDLGTFVLAIRRDAATSDAAAGDYHALHVDALGKLRVTGTFAEDAASNSGDEGHFVLAIRRDAATSDAAAGDYHALHVDALGKLRVTGTFPEDAAHTSGDEGHFVMGVQSLTRTARSADGDYTPLAVGAAGEGFSAIVPEGNSAWATSNGGAMGAASGVIKASAGKLYTVTVTNDNAAARWIQFFNTTSVPADTAVPVISIKLAAGETKQFTWGALGRYFSTGICWANSTTGPTKTIGSGDTEIDVQYL